LAAALRFADEERELDAEERELDDERPRELDEERLRLDAERLPEPDERLDPLDFLDLPPELPLLRRSAIWLPLFPANWWFLSYPRTGDYLTSKRAVTGAWSDSRSPSPSRSGSSRSSGARRRGRSATSSSRASTWSIA
jgi:hypothetical protein